MRAYSSYCDELAICDAEVTDAKYFSILADETSDFSRQEQLAVCLRYVRGYSVIERFPSFELAPDLTSRGLATQLLSILDAHCCRS